MVICSLDALKKPLKKKETRIEKESVEVLQQASDCRKKTGKKNFGMMQFLPLTWYLLVRLTLTLTLAFAFIDCF